MRRRETAGCGHPLPFAAAAGPALGLALFAHQLLLTLAAVVIGPLPAVQTALYLSRKDLSENAAQAVSRTRAGNTGRACTGGSRPACR